MKLSQDKYQVRGSDHLQKNNSEFTELTHTMGHRHLPRIFIPMFLIVLTCYQWHTSDKKMEKMHQVQEIRKKLIRETCESDEYLSNWKLKVEELSSGGLFDFLVDDDHGILYCYVPKVGCTNWKRVMVVMKRGEPYQDPMSISSGYASNIRSVTRLNEFSKEGIKARLKHYTKFMFVREPFVRLISAYRDKFVDLHTYYYETFAKPMMAAYGNNSNPPETAQEAHSANVRPSFKNFVQYLLDPETERRGPYNYHWRQMYRLCYPCHIQYDFIGHQETLEEDALQVLKMLNLENDIKFPPHYVNVTTNALLAYWFKDVSLEDRRKLFKIYEKDYRLFGYSKPKELFDD